MIWLGPVATRASIRERCRAARHARVRDSFVTSRGSTCRHPSLIPVLRATAWLSSAAALEGSSPREFLRKGDVEVMLVDRTNHHLFQPLLYQVATGILSVGQIAPPLRGILRKHKNVHVELAEVTGFDLENRTVLGRPARGTERAFPYDSLIVAPGAADLVLRTRGPRQALTPDEDDRRRPQPATADIRGVRAGRDGAIGSRAPAGGSPSPSSVADRPGARSRDRSPSSPAGRSRRTSARSTPRAPSCSSSTPARTSSRRSAIGLSRKATSGLEQHGRRDPHRDAGDEHRRRRHGRRVSERPERIATHTVVWAAGVQASPLARILADASGADCDRAGRVAVRPTARCRTTLRSSSSATR